MTDHLKWNRLSLDQFDALYVTAFKRLELKPGVIHAP